MYIQDKIDYTIDVVNVTLGLVVFPVSILAVGMTRICIEELQKCHKK